MIVSRIIGGIGNQMFQYSAGKALASRLGVELKLDISGFTKYKLRNFELDKFQTKISIASAEEIRKIKFAKEKLHAKIKRKVFRKPPPFTPNVYLEPHFHYDKNFEKLTDGTYLSGSFQSERYFISARDTLLNEFTPCIMPTGEVAEIADNISSSNSVSIHVRRGDYIANPNTKAFHGVCSVDYYKKAIDYIAKSTNSPVFFIFSDDIGWVQKNLSIQYEHFLVSNFIQNPHMELHLMSKCKHHIIANSSFSWWAAWLNNYTRKTVISPETWFRVKHLDTKDLIPSGWITLK